MVKAKWVGLRFEDQKLVVESVSLEEENKLPPFVQDTLNAGYVAIHKGVAYALSEKHAREKLEW